MVTLRYWTNFLGDMVIFKRKFRWYDDIKVDIRAWKLVIMCSNRQKNVTIVKKFNITHYIQLGVPRISNLVYIVPYNNITPKRMVTLRYWTNFLGDMVIFKRKFRWYDDVKVDIRAWKFVIMCSNQQKKCHYSKKN